MAEHVGFHFGNVKSKLGIEPPFWKKGMLKVFLSHLAVDRTFAGALQQCLFEYGISCFVAHNDIEPTMEWLAEIETALATGNSIADTKLSRKQLDGSGTGHCDG